MIDERTADFERLLNEMSMEIGRAIMLHGPQDDVPWMRHADGWLLVGNALELVSRQQQRYGVDWASILLEEVGELLQASTPEGRRAEAIQVAAMAMQIARIHGGARVRISPSALEEW